MGGTNITCRNPNADRRIGMENNFSAEAKVADGSDQLKAYRKKFLITDAHVIYLNGNSLGRLPLASKELAQKVISEEWGQQLIGGWNKRWYKLSAKLGAKLSLLIGAKAHEVIFADSTSVNLFKLAYAALQCNPLRKKIIIDAFNFPSDHYILQGVVQMLSANHEIIIIPSVDGVTINEKDIENALDNEVALVCLSYVGYQTSFKYNMRSVTQMVHAAGAKIIWDLSHAAGAVPVDLNGCQADYAVGCSYKYLNGGPGSTAYLYVREDLIPDSKTPVWGWFGSAKPFDFDLQYEPSEGIQRFLAGTPPVLSLSVVEPALDMIFEAGIDRIEAKSKGQSEYFITMLRFLHQKFRDLELSSPKNPAQRGSHITIRHPHAAGIIQAMINPLKSNVSVITDFRKPNFIRFGLTPLYTSYQELYMAYTRLHEILDKKEYLNYPERIQGVT